MSSIGNRSEITLGILAGGRALRLGGIDKSWVRRSGIFQVERWRDRFSADVDAVLVSTNRDPRRYVARGLVTVADREGPLAGPLAGLDALAATCSTPWLFTIPVDLLEVDDSLLPRLFQAAAGQCGAFAVDDDGRQPLVALWHVDALRGGLRLAAAAGEAAAHSLLTRLAMSPVRFTGRRFGNLNTHADLLAAGAAPE